MPEHGNARGLGTAGAKDDDQHPSITRALTEEARLALEFLAGLSDPRASWAERFEAFADERHLTPDLRHSVRVAILRLRMFHAAERFQPRPRRRR